MKKLISIDKPFAIFYASIATYLEVHIPGGMAMLKMFSRRPTVSPPDIIPFKDDIQSNLKAESLLFELIFIYIKISDSLSSPLKRPHTVRGKPINEVSQGARIRPCFLTGPAAIPLSYQTSQDEYSPLLHINFMPRIATNDSQHWSIFGYT